MQEDLGVKKKLKILYMITKGTGGGAQEYVYTLATSLPRETFKVVVLCGEGDILPDKLEHAGIPVYRLKTLVRDVSFAKEIKSFFEILKIIKQEKPDILHVNSSKIGGLGGLAGRLLRVPHIIFTAHGWASNEQSRTAFSRSIIFSLHWITVFLSHLTIAVSEKTKKDIATRFIDEKIHVIYNGIGNIAFIPRDESRTFLQSFVPSIDNRNIYPHIYIGTVSELHSNKGLDVLIKSCKRLPDSVAVFIIGDGEEKAALQKQISENHLDSRVFLVGRVEYAKQYLLGLDIFILTSRNENLPYVLLEAGQAGLPVIASKVGGIPEIIKNGENGILVTPGKSGEIVRAIEFLLGNPEIGKEYGEKLKLKIKKEFNVETMIEKTIEVYRTS